MSLIPVLAVGAGLAAGASALITYATVGAEAQVFGPTLVAPPGARQVALTFDDGPNPIATPRLLEVLARHQVRATFFLIGRYARLEPALTREIADAGHAIGNHTMTHPWLPRYSEARIQAELEECNAVLQDVLGKPVTMFRPPHGAKRPAVLRSARDLGLTTVQWNCIPGDWKPISALAILSRVESAIASHRAAGKGTNVVLHDGGQHQAAAARLKTVEAIRMLLNKGGDTEYVVPPDWR